MKTSLLLKATALALCLTALSTTAVQADPKKQRSDQMLINEPERYVYVTGSHIPQKVQLRSIGTNTPWNLRIYTQRELESTGRQTPGEALAALDPSITLRGR